MNNNQNEEIKLLEAIPGFISDLPTIDPSEPLVERYHPGHDCEMTCIKVPADGIIRSFDLS